MLLYTKNGLTKEKHSAGFIDILDRKIEIKYVRSKLKSMTIPIEYSRNIMKQEKTLQKELLWEQLVVQNIYLN